MSIIINKRNAVIKYIGARSLFVDMVGICKINKFDIERIHLVSALELD